MNGSWEMCEKLEKLTKERWGGGHIAKRGYFMQKKN